MADVHDKKTRSYNMSRIKSKNSKPEMIVRKLCHKLGLRFRLHQKIGLTRPELIFKKFNSVILVNGCFWHSHYCKAGNKKPKSNKIFWTRKLSENKKRDQRNIRNLKANGWRILVIWECQLKSLISTENKIKKFFFIRV